MGQSALLQRNGFLTTPLGTNTKQMEKEFVPFELAVKLKELGFDFGCIAYYDKKSIFYPMGVVYSSDSMHFSSFEPRFQYKPDLEPLIAAPLWQQVFDWFRDKHKLPVTFKPVFSKKQHRIFRVNVYINEVCKPIFKSEFPDVPYFDSYQSARTACLEKLIELTTKTQQNGK